MISALITRASSIYCPTAGDGNILPPSVRQVLKIMMSGKSKQIVRYAMAASLVAALTFVCYHLRPIISETDVIMIFLVGTVATAVWTGRGPAVLYSLLCVSAFNYFFIEPLFQFNVYNPSYWLTFAVMFLASIVISTLTTKLNTQVQLAENRERETHTLYQLLTALNAAKTTEEMVEALSQYLRILAGGTVRIVLAGSIIEIPIAISSTSLPIVGSQRTIGYVEFDVALPASGDRKKVLETCIALFASMMEGAEKARQAEQSKIWAETEKTRNILLSSISHDLRSPLAAISGSAETLLEKLPQDPLLMSIQQESRRLARIVSNLLDITRMEGGQIRLNMMAYDPAEIIGSAVAACRESLRQHKLSLNVEKDLPFVRMDGLLTSQLMQNLLENASRHTPANTGIELKAYLREGSFCIAVSDNGPGIPAGSEKNIFNKFVSLPSEGKPKGVGLGLAICQAIALAHQGRIYAQNRAEGGCRFVVEFPQSLTLQQAQEPAHG